MLRGVLEVAVGIAAGGILGMFVRYFPSHDQVKNIYINSFKSLLYKRFFAKGCYSYVTHFQVSYEAVFWESSVQL